MISKYVIKTTHNNEDVLFHSVTKKILPANIDESTLEKELFLERQNKLAIEYATNLNYGVLGLTIIPSWECNLRCKHCSVIGLLKDQSDQNIDIDKLEKFAISYINEFHPEFITLDFVGGEPLLRPTTCLTILKRFKELQKRTGVIVISDITTNATVEFTDEIIEFLSGLDDINISIDGNHEQHNSQRIPYKGKFDPYSRTIANLEKLVELGLGSKIRIKTALKDEYITKDNYRAFLKLMANIGIDIDKINYGCLHPTEHLKTTSKNYQYSFGSKPTIMPCCKYRVSSVYLIEPSGDIYDVPFKWARTKLGTLDDNIETITNNRIKIISESFVCYKDDKCMECPVIGFCWGGCVTAAPMHNGKPSEHCNQSRLIELVTNAAKTGDLINNTLNKLPLSILHNNDRICINKDI